MHAEQFLRYNNGNGYKTLKTDGLDQLLNAESFAKLAQLNVKRGVEYAIVETWMDNEQIYAQSYLKPIRDNLGRTALVNHTICMRYKDLAKLHTRSLNLEQYFIRDTESTPFLHQIDLGE